MRTVFRLRHKRGRGHIDFDDYNLILLTRGQHSEWIPFVLNVNEHDIVENERVLTDDELNFDRLWMLKKGFEK